MNYYDMLLARKLAKGELPPNAYLLKEVSGSLVSFDDGADLPMPSFISNIDAVQDLHGQDAPWVGGAGKNKLKVTATSQTTNGVTFTVNADGSVTAVASSTRPGNAWFPIATGINISAGSILSGGKSADIFIQIINSQGTQLYKNASTEVTIAEDLTNVTVRLGVYSGIFSQTYTFLPMIRTSGDSSFAPYENICPISGHTGVDAWVRGKNLIDMPNRIISTSLSISTISCESCTATKNGEVITATITGAWSKLSIQVKNGIQLKNGETYTFSATFDNPNGNRIGLTHRYLNGSWNTLTSVVTDTHIRLSGSFTYDSSINDYVICSCLINNTNASTNNTVTVKDIMLEKGSTVSDWNAYNPNSQTIQVSWQTEAGEVFGGYVDLVSGELTVTDGYIASYNGETLPNTWISDRDTYAEGTTPTTGAEVVYKLATPQTYQLTPTQIKSLKDDITNAWCSTGDVILEYFGKGAE